MEREGRNRIEENKKWEDVSAIKYGENNTATEK